MGQYATKTAFYELEINQTYQGTYVFMEKIKRDKNRVDISKNKEDDISGGYIIKIDKPTGDGVDPHRKVGWMVRNNLDTNSKHVNATTHGDGLTSLP